MIGKDVQHRGLGLSDTDDGQGVKKSFRSLIKWDSRIAQHGEENRILV